MDIEVGRPLDEAVCKHVFGMSDGNVAQL